MIEWIGNWKSSAETKPEKRRPWRSEDSPVSTPVGSVDADADADHQSVDQQTTAKRRRRRFGERSATAMVRVGETRAREQPADCSDPDRCVHMNSCSKHSTQ